MKTKTTTSYHFPVVTVDVTMVTIEDNCLKVLLIKRTRDPFKGKLALPGGFLAQDEKAEHAVARIVKDKAGVNINEIYIEQLYAFDDPQRDPRGRVISIAYFALVPREKIKFESGEHLQAPLLFPVSSHTTLAFDHSHIVHYALQRLRYKLEYTNAVFSLLPRHFTFLELQRVYEAVWNKKLDKRNFRKKFFALGLIKPTKKKRIGDRHRPAELYTFIQRKPIFLQKFF